MKNNTHFQFGLKPCSYSLSTGYSSRIESCDRDFNMNKCFDYEAAWKAAQCSVMSYCKNKCLHLREEDLEDFASNAVLRAVERFGTFKPEKASFKTWVSTIARNLVCDSLNKGKKTVSGYDWSLDTIYYQQGEFDKSGEDILIEEEVEEEREFLEKKFRSAIGELPELHTEVLRLRGEGMKSRQVAQTLGISPQQETLIYYRAKAKIRHLLGAA